MSEPTEAGSELQDAADQGGTILVAVDTSALAQRVVSIAARLSRSMRQATIQIVHVFRAGRLNGVRGGAQVSAADLIEDAKEHLEFHVSAAKKQSRTQVVSHFIVGDPTAELLRLTAELKADFLVVGTHDEAGFERFLLGSVAETLVRKAGCSVIVVRPHVN